MNIRNYLTQFLSLAGTVVFAAGFTSCASPRATLVSPPAATITTRSIDREFDAESGDWKIVQNQN